MRQITKDILAPPADLISNNCKRQLKKIITSRKGGKATYYHKKKVVEALNNLYINKCGYCESRINVVASENVEHYRPKAGVDEIDLVAGTTHGGYFWLANEWSNLLIACPKCNQPGNKGNRFPLSDPLKRVFKHPSMLASGEIDFKANHYNSIHISGEVPLLLNPEHKNPEKEFVLKRNGELKSNDKSIFAFTTIDVCDLNRVPLTIARQKIIDGIINDINNQIKAWHSSVAPLSEAQFRIQLDYIFEKILQRLADESEYTFVAKMIIKNFETLILDEIEKQFRSVILNQFNSYIKKN